MSSELIISSPPTAGCAYELCHWSTLDVCLYMPAIVIDCPSKVSGREINVPAAAAC